MEQWQRRTNEKNVRTSSGALDKVKALRGVEFEWNDPVNHDEGLQIGFIGQETEKVLPEVVDSVNDHYTMQYAPITALLVEGMKEQQEDKERLKTRVSELEELVVMLYEKIFGQYVYLIAAVQNNVYRFGLEIRRRTLSYVMILSKSLVVISWDFMVWTTMDDYGQL